MNDNSSWQKTINRVLVLTALYCFGCSEPFFDLTARYSTFYVAHQLFPSEVLCVTLLIALAIPLLLALKFVALHLLGWKRLADLEYILFLNLLLLVDLLVFSNMLLPEDMNLYLQLSLILVVHVGCLWMLVKQPKAKQFLAWCALIVLISPIRFFLHPGIHDVISTSSVVKDEPTRGDFPPVILVVFDEFSTVSLMNEEYKVDRNHFPNFSAFADQSTWYRNASTVAIHTDYALSGIVTGRLPRKNKTPTSASYPDNIIRRIKAHYKVNSLESISRFNEERNVVGEYQESQSELFRSFVVDSGVVFAHLILPPQVREHLPNIQGGWGDFVTHLEKMDHESEKGKNGTIGSGQRVERFLSFIESMSPNGFETPTFHFVHIELPHVKWQYTKSLKQYYPYQDIPGLSCDDQMWLDNEYYAHQGRQRHLMQLQAVDTLLGKMLKRLREIELFDQSLIIVTADHGVAFGTKQSLRDNQYVNNVSDILSVPMFVKLPGQSQGRIIDDNVQSIDLVPSIYQYIGLELPWEAEGQAVFVDPPEPLPIKKLVGHSWHGYGDRHKNKVFRYPGDLIPKIFKAADIKVAHFPTSNKPLQIMGLDFLKGFVNKPLDEFKVNADPENMLVVWKFSIRHAEKTPDDTAVTRVIVFQEGMRYAEAFGIAAFYKDELYTIAPLYTCGRKRCASIILPEATPKEHLNHVKFLIQEQKFDRELVMPNIIVE